MLSNLRQTKNFFFKNLYSASIYFCILDLFFIYSPSLCFASSRRFLYRSRSYWGFFFCSSSEIFLSHEHIGTFCLFLLQEDSGAFHEPFLKSFLCFFDDILLTILCVGKKITENNFISFFQYALKINFKK